MLTLRIAAAAALAILSTGAFALPNTASGSAGGLSWTAQSTIVGVTSTATVASGGDARYTAAMPKYSGVVSLIMDYGAGGSFICSGSLMNDRRSILTAGHCVSDGAGTAGPLSTTAYFYGGSNPDTVVPFNPLSTAIGVSSIFVNSGYTGEVIDQNDIAVLRLAEAAPLWATSYGLYTDSDLTGQDFNVAGYGRRSDTGGSVGANLGTGRLRQGDNRYDFRLGDSDFGGGWSAILGGTASYDYSYVSDFDNGKAGNDASCAIATDPFFGLSGPKYCDLGLGADEVGVAGGDSGGPQFIGGRLASVTSYGLSFGADYGDVDNALNSSFGEFSGYVPVYLHAGWITSLLVPEPGSLALALGGLVALARVKRRRA